MNAELDCVSQPPPLRESAPLVNQMLERFDVGAFEEDQPRKRGSRRARDRGVSHMKWPWIVVWVFVALVIVGLVGIPIVHLVGLR
jgi:hypothetical protein